MDEAKRRLAKATGISHREARDLLKLVDYDLAVKIATVSKATKVDLVAVAERIRAGVPIIVDEAGCFDVLPATPRPRQA